MNYCILPPLNLQDIHGGAKKSTLKWNVAHVSYPFYPHKANNILLPTKIKSNTPPSE